ncbi:MAG TPA: hypothetical protein EYM39_11325 [Candidatus Latescibacteria bacterium]|nr:hypothetical protein [Candidatus Latescibacterota bacterium]
MNTPPVDFVRVEAGAHTEFLERCLKTCGLAHDHAEFMASRLTWADLRGIHSHGASQVQRYVSDLQSGTVNPMPEISVIRENDTSIVVDGDGGYGYLPTARVTESIIGKAREHGLAAGSLQHIGHYGSASHYTSMCADAGCIGFSVQGLVSGFDFPDSRSRCGVHARSASPFQPASGRPSSSMAAPISSRTRIWICSSGCRPPSS